MHHALLLTGPVGIGKLALSKRLAAYLLCKNPLQHQPCGLCKSCQLMASGHHPDLWQLPTEGSSSIGVDPIRALGQFMQGASQQGGVKLAIIPQAELMTEAAANALLKTSGRATTKQFSDFTKCSSCAIVTYYFKPLSKLGFSSCLW